MFDNKTILVTGATSGIGAATAEAFARDGGTIVAVGRNNERGQTLIETLAGTDHQFIPCDLSDRDQAQSLVDQVLERTQTIDVLVNNAGVVHHATVPDTSDKEWSETIAVNVDAVFYLSRGFIPHMIEHGGGAIINIASTWGLVGAERTAAYCASKGAVIQLTRCMALDHAKDNVRINAVCPGAVDTPMLESEAIAFGISAQQAREQWGASAANKKLATAKDIANAVTFLASDNATHIHGVALPVDGGSIAG